MSAISARTLGHALRGEGAHVEVSAALDGMDWRVAGARPEGAPHSVFRLLNHMIYWQDLFLQRLTGARVASPARAVEGWPGDDAPRNAAEWTGAVERFNQASDRAQRQSLVNRFTIGTKLKHTLAVS